MGDVDTKPDEGGREQGAGSRNWKGVQASGTCADLGFLDRIGVLLQTKSLGIRDRQFQLLSKLGLGRVLRNQKMIEACVGGGQSV